MALVGGFGVGSIHRQAKVQIGAYVDIGQEIGHFSLGSTVCLLIPYDCHFEKLNYLKQVNVGEDLSLNGFEKTKSKPSTYLEAPVEM